MRLLKVLCWGLGFAWAAGAMAQGLVQASDAPPDWTEEAPVLSRLIEEGYAAQTAKAPVVAAARFCAAARFGSVEAQYRLGRLFLQRSDADGRDQGRAMLALAAQRGDERAQQLLGDAPAPDALPDCLLTGESVVFSLADDNAVVPVEVVERYVLALPQYKRRLAQLIQRLAPRFGVDARFALAIARAESNFEPNAVSARNAMGLMQLIPDTAERFGVRNAFDPEQNVRGGLAYLRWLLARFNGNILLTSAAYNAGEKAVDNYNGVPPYAETRAYVERILRFYRSPVHVRPAPVSGVAPSLSIPSGPGATPAG